MKETISLLVKPTPFEDESNRVESIKFMLEVAESISSETQYPVIPTEESTAYFVEFPLYTSFPDITTATYHSNSNESHWAVIRTVSREVTANYTSNPTISYICALIIPDQPSAFNGGDAQAIYDTAESIANKHIKLYKLTPHIHHHDLNERNNTISGYIAPVLTYKIYPKIEYSDGAGLLLNQGISTLLVNQHPLSQRQLQTFLGGFEHNDSSEFHNTLYRLVKAYDYNCYGDADSSIIFSTASVEGFLITMEVLVRVREYGVDYTAALKKAKGRHLADLAKTAQKLYELNISTSSQRNTYGKWHTLCYRQRNNIIHKQDTVSPLISRPALDASANLILHIARKVRRKYSRSSDVMLPIEDFALGILGKT